MDDSSVEHLGSGAGGVDRGALERALSEFARALLGPYDVGQMLYRLTDQVLEVLDVAGAGSGARVPGACSPPRSPAVAEGGRARTRALRPRSRPVRSTRQDPSRGTSPVCWPCARGRTPGVAVRTRPRGRSRGRPGRLRARAGHRRARRGPLRGVAGRGHPRSSRSPGRGTRSPGVSRGGGPGQPLPGGTAAPTGLPTPGVVAHRRRTVTSAAGVSHEQTPGTGTRGAGPRLPASRPTAWPRPGPF